MINIENYRAIVEGAPEKSLTHHDGNHYWQYTNENGWCRYCNPIAKLVVGEPSSKNKSLHNLRTIIAQHDELQAKDKRIGELESALSNLFKGFRYYQAMSLEEKVELQKSAEEALNNE